MTLSKNSEEYIKQIPIYRPTLSGNEKEYIIRCIDSTWISSKGGFTLEFEQKFAEYIGTRYATTVSSGTAALHLALLALGAGPGSEVIVPTLTFVASANAIAYTGATPIFADSLESTWQIDPDDIRRKITPKTCGIIAVHLYGHPCDMDALTAITKEFGIFMIEDCAEAIGSRYKKSHVGNFGEIAAFSFYGNKTITTGEGGIIATNNKTLYDRAVHLKGQGLSPHRQYWHDVIGYNYRMTNLCAAIGLAQLEQVDAFVSKKRQIASWYRNELKDLPLRFHDEIGDVVNSYWMCSVLVSDALLREKLRDYLAGLGIETRPVFYPIHTMPIYSQNYQHHSVAEDISLRGINLPSWPGLTAEDVNFICNSIREFLNKH
ncbi:MAG: rfbE [Firmicutes bacterium]|nr:rfbE [Bacillota bacterium]